MRLQLSNLHGDIVAEASTDHDATKPLRTFEADEFGVPRQTDDTRYGWLGSKRRPTELASGVIQMGVRSYLPSLGRFLQVDPVVGGSANPYEYAAQDPVNNFDLDGRACVPCGYAIGAGARELIRHGLKGAGRRAVRKVGGLISRFAKSKKPKSRNTGGHDPKKQSTGSKKRTAGKHHKRRPGDTEKGDENRPYRRK